MKETRYYEVAGHRFCVSGEEGIFALMTNYEPFACADGATVFSLAVGTGDAPDYTEELRQEDEGLRVGERRSGVEQTIICGHTAVGEAVFEFYWWGVSAGWLVCSGAHKGSDTL